MKIAKLKQVPRVRQARGLYRRATFPFTRWWRRYDRRWRWWWRAGNLLALIIVVAGIVLPVVSTILTNDSYKLSPAARHLVGASDAKLAKQLIWSAEDQAWQFNAKGVVGSTNLPGGAGAASALAAMRAQVGTPSGKDKDTSTYALTLPQDLSQGITYTDTNTQLAFSLVPEFKTHAGRMVDGHIIYPLPGGMQAIYTLKDNGLKEDIFVPASHNPTLSFGFKLKLPDTLAARQLPDGSGGIGIYSADPSLYGNVTYGGSSDQQTVMRARRTAQKNNLVFALPAPAITAPRGVSLGSSASRFEQSQNELTVAADGLDSLHAPLSIDPSVVVTSASDFSSGNNEDNIDFSTSGQITRGGLTGGSVSAGWKTTTNIPSSRSNFGTVVYNGFIYIMGGSPNNTTSCYNDVYYAALNADGTIGTWTSTTRFPNARQSFGAVTYDGYIYIMGGSTYTQHFYDVEYAPINADGSLGTWKTANSLPTGNYYSCNVTAYNGYIYACFGKYASINADGTIGTWQSTSSPTNGGSILLANNRYIYSITNNAGGNTIQYAPINVDGTVGSWLTANQGSEPSAPYWFGASIYNGYLYLLGGPNTISYAAIMANGTLAAWQNTSPLPTGTYYPGTAAYNGYIYALGGITSNGSNSPQSTVQYAKIDPAGVTASYAATSSFTTTRSGFGTVAYNGYLYVMGGSNSSNYLNDVQYAPLNANGTVGTWQTTTSFTTARNNFGTVAYNGYLYVLGGYNGSLIFNDVQYAPINANGTIGAWSTTASFTTSRDNFGAVAYAGYLYVVAGRNGSNSPLSDVQYAPINADGTVGTWQATTSLATARKSLGAVAYGGYLYAMGGFDSTGSPLNDVQYAPINADGTISAWSTTTPISREYFSAVAYNGYLYIMGGLGSTGYLNSVQYAPINADGTIGTWSTTTSFTTSRYYLGAIAYNGYLYIMGGFNGSSTFNDVQYAQINNGGPGTATAWQATTSFTGYHSGFGAVAYNGYLYIMGGFDNINRNYLSDVQYAPISANGTIGAWQTTTSLTTARDFLRAVAYDGYLYVLGGYNGSSFLSDVQYAHINANGTIGAWQAATSLPTGRSSFGAAIYNGYLYVMGGDSVSSRRNDVQYAPISANGTIGTWQTTTSFATSREELSAIAYNGYLYIMGGDGGSSDGKLNDVQYAPINSNGTIGIWQTTTSLTTARNSFNAVAYNGYLYIMGGGTNSGYLNDVQYAPINSNGTIGIWQTTTSFANTRSSFGAAIYNGYLYVMGGFEGTGGNDVQYASLSSTARIGHYSKLIDLGTAVGVTGVTFNGTSGGGISVNYRSAGADGVFGASGSINDMPSGCTSGAAGTRYLLLMVALDDSYGQGTGGSFPDSAGTPANLTDLTVNYSTGHPPPNIRLRDGQTMQQGNLSALDTCS